MRYEIGQSFFFGQRFFHLEILTDDPESKGITLCLDFRLRLTCHLLSSRSIFVSHSPLSAMMIKLNPLCYEFKDFVRIAIA
jgi:hypothetical protein